MQFDSLKKTKPTPKSALKYEKLTERCALWVFQKKRFIFNYNFFVKRMFIIVEFTSSGTGIVFIDVEIIVKQTLVCLFSNFSHRDFCSFLMVEKQRRRLMLRVSRRFKLRQCRETVTMTNLSESEPCKTIFLVVRFCSQLCRDIVRVFFVRSCVVVRTMFTVSSETSI